MNMVCGTRLKLKSFYHTFVVNSLDFSVNFQVRNRKDSRGIHIVTCAAKYIVLVWYMTWRLPTNINSANLSIVLLSQLPASLYDKCGTSRQCCYKRLTPHHFFQTSTDGNITISEMIFTPVPEDNGKQVICSVTADSLAAGTTGVFLKDGRTLDVKREYNSSG